MGRQCEPLVVEVLTLLQPQALVALQFDQTVFAVHGSIDFHKRLFDVAEPCSQREPKKIIGIFPDGQFWIKAPDTLNRASVYNQCLDVDAAAGSEEERLRVGNAAERFLIFPSGILKRRLLQERVVHVNSVREAGALRSEL